MRVGVTGATGFVGRELLCQLTTNGDSVIAWHRPTSDLERMGNLQNHKSIQWVPGSLEHCDSLDWMRDCDAIVHSGLWRESTSFQASPTQVSHYAQVNIVGTLKLIEAAIQFEVPRFVFLSTCAVHDVILSDRQLDETHPLWPKSHYGAHKAAIEKFVHSFGLGGGYPICALRPTGIYGRRNPIGLSKWYALVQSICRGEEVSVGRGGKEVHVVDVARAIRLLLGAELANITGQAYSCYDRYISEYDVAEITKELTGSKSTIVGGNKVPKNQIETSKLKSLGMKFGGEALLRETIQQLVHPY